MKSQVEAKFSFYPYLYVCERTTQLTQTLWDVDSRQNILWRSSSLWIIQKYTKKSLCCSQFPLLLLWLKIGIPDSSSFVQSFFSSINLELWMLPPSSAVVYSWRGGDVQMLFLSNKSSHGQSNGMSQD